MTDTVPASLPAVIELVDEYMYRVLKGAEDSVLVIGELMGALTEPNAEVSEVSEGSVGRLYPLFGDLSDIVDGFPFDYGDGTEMIAQREIRDDAWDWLTTARNADGLKAYVDRWIARSAALPTIEDGRPFRDIAR
ncbi:hypothetical protein [Micromonospora saelicesensis]|uniref:hypothetical protein n=1 Tax=Micromonospora saelicesensis TaxID=285676 RepID=UPI0011BF91D6|nr:hypothetical protein [Micromonospora saelicesensis]